MSSIVLYTGVPGAGKTLRSIYDGIKEKANGRFVYTFNVDGINEEVLDKAPFESIENWRDLPSGSILIVDEAHIYFPVRSPGKPPEWIQKLTEIRHFGIELWLITQDPRNIDAFVRRLIGTHFHVERKMGLNGAIVWRFDAVSEDPRDYHNKLTATKETWKYPKHLFQAYKSATIHVQKRHIPAKFIFYAFLLLLCIVGIPFLIYKMWNSVSSMSDSVAPSVSSSQQKSSNSLLGQKNVGTLKYETAEEYYKAHQPVVPFVPHTAPVYQDLLEPQQIPEIFCVIGGDYETRKDLTCNCYTEQGTKYGNVPFSVCESYAMGGYYNPYKISSNKNRRESSKEE